VRAPGYRERAVKHRAASLALVFAVVVATRLPFLNQAIQGDDVYYLYGAQRAQIEPLHPAHTSYVFAGETVDMRGHPHGPLNSWVLGALLGLAGEVREVPFHLAYVAFSLAAAWGMWRLARRFSGRPLEATLLWAAAAPFVVNGNSLEADLPFLAFWMVTTALFLEAVDEESVWKLAACALAAELAAVTAYQAVFLTPVLGGYLWTRRRWWLPGWVAALAAPAGIVWWQVWEWSATGALPAAVLAGYMESYGLQGAAQKARSAVALVVHAGWIVSPLVALALIRHRLLAGAAGAGALGAALYDSHPLFWISVFCGLLMLGRAAAQRDFLAWWVVVFFAGAVGVFFAGSARYLLPMAAPVAITAARVAGPRLLWWAFGAQMALSLALAIANYQHWDGYRRFASGLAAEAASKRVWVNGEWGLRHYLESAGALPLTRDQPLQPGEVVVSASLSAAVTPNVLMAPLAEEEITPGVPLRLISLSGRPAYSSSARGLLPFEISRAPADRVRAEVVLERKAELSYLDPRDPKARAQVLSGLFADGWMGARAAVLLKAPPGVAPLRVEVYIPPDAPARRVQMLVGGEVIAEEVFPRPGSYALAAPYRAGTASLAVSLTADKTYRVAGDERELGVVVTGVGFR
jgi:hypothetical protein